MRIWLTLAALLLPTSAALADCTVADPSSTPLNVRESPNGTILTTLANGTAVRIVGPPAEDRGRPWVFVEAPPGKPLGWVAQGLLNCQK